MTILGSFTPSDTAADVRETLTARIRTSRLDRLIASATRASKSNPRTAGLYAGSVTITDNSNVIPSQVSQVVTYPVSDANRGVWHVVGGKMIRPGLNNVVTALQDGSGTGYNYSYSRFEAMVHARYLCVRVATSTTVPYRFLIDGQYVSLTGTVTVTPGAGSTNYLLLDFGTRAIRRVAIEGQGTAAALYTGYVEATGKMWAVDLSDAIHGVILGDSYVAGSNAIAKGDGAFVQMADRLGVYIHASGVGGTGWNHTTQPPYTFNQRIAAGDLALSYYTPDIIFLMGSYNDRNADKTVLQANATAGIQAARAQYPSVPIVVFGAAPGNTGPSQIILDAENAVAAAVTAVADPLIGFVPFSTDPLGAWITGAGRVGSTGNNGNSDYLTDTDGIHPVDPEGVGFLGQRYAVGAASALKAMRTSV